MNNKIIREVDAQGRINLKSDLLELYHIETKKKVAICSLGEDKISIRNFDNLKNCKVIACAHLDDKGRIIIPVEIRGESTKFEIYGFNGDLILEEAH